MTESVGVEIEEVQVMITVSRTITTTGEKFAGAVRFAHDSAGYIKSKTGVDFKVEVPVGGNPMRLRWIAQLESLAAFELMNAKLSSDPKYMDMVAKTTQHVLPGTTVDEIWQST